MRTMLVLLFVLLFCTPPAHADIRDLGSGLLSLRGDTYQLILDCSGGVSGKPLSIHDRSLLQSLNKADSDPESPALTLVAGNVQSPVFPQVLGFEIIGLDSLVIQSQLVTSVPAAAPLLVRQTLITQHNQLLMELDFTVDDTTDLLDEVYLDIDGNDESVLHFVNAHQTIDVDYNKPQAASYGMQLGVVVRNLADRMMLVPSNPYYGYFEHDDDGLRNIIFRTKEPHGTEPGPLVHSVLVPGQHVVRNYSLVFVEGAGVSVLPDDNYLFISPHSYGRDGTVGLIGDDLPLRNNWTPITVPDDPDEPTKSAIVQLMNEHPNLQMNLVITYDYLKDFWPVGSAITRGWSMNRGNVSFVPFDASDGDRCLRMDVSADTNVYVEQSVELEAGDLVTVSVDYMLPGPLAEGGRLTFSLFNEENGYEYWSWLTDPAPSWTSAEVPLTLPVPEDGTYTFRITLARAGCSVFIDNISLDASGRDVSLRNPGFELGHTHLTYLDGRYRWSDVRSDHNMVEHATEEYREFLQRLDSKTVLYGFEDRIGTGIHALHHSSKGNFVGSAPIGQDFSLVDPEVHRSTMDGIFHDWEQLGLSRRAVDIMRTSGIHYHHQTVQEALRHEIRWMDAGLDPNARSLFPCYGYGEQIWLQNTIGWFDAAPGGFSSFQPTYETMAQGGVAMLGFHPRALFYHNQNLDGKEWLSDQISTLEQLFPHSCWERVEDIAYRGRSLDSLRILAQYVDPITLEQVVEFEGVAHDGTTMMLLLNPWISVNSNAMLNGSIELPLESRELRRFIVLPDLENGHHELRFRTVSVSNEAPVSTLPAESSLDVWPLPSNGPVRVQWKDSRLLEHVTGVLYNLQGRVVKRFEWQPSNYQVNAILPMSDVASGLYLLRLSHPGDADLIKVRRVLMIK
ncbi:T9SS type A sorting domain-containing protein [bacterium]|nr:T9SS type A sorting domain-containing protein [bacterium]